MNALALQDNPLISPEAAAKWFLHDMAEVSGFLMSGFNNMSPLSVYASYRPILTKPDPWYYAGVVALEVSAVTELFTKDGADDILRGVFDQMDGIVGRTDEESSQLTMLLLGRLGLGSLLMGRKVPDNLMSRIMLMLLGDDKNVKKMMPEEGAHDQLRAALKSGKPVWWKMFARRYRLTTAPNSAIASRLTIQITNNRNAHLPDDLPVHQGPTQGERTIKLEALRVALEKAEISMPSPSNDGVVDETLTDNTPQAAIDAILEEDEVMVDLYGVSDKAPAEDDLPLDDGTLSLEGFRVD